jgi:hypothetical protein
MYPHRSITKRAVAELDTRRRRELENLCRNEIRRITAIPDEHSLRVEIDEARQKWDNAYSHLREGQSTAYMTLDVARFEMGLANQRYWTALAQLDRVLGRTRLVTRVQFWLIVVGGLLIALIGSIYAVLSYYKAGN